MCKIVGIPIKQTSSSSVKAKTSVNTSGPSNDILRSSNSNPNPSPNPNPSDCSLHLSTPLPLKAILRAKPLSVTQSQPQKPRKHDIDMDVSLKFRSLFMSYPSIIYNKRSVHYSSSAEGEWDGVMEPNPNPNRLDIRSKSEQQREKTVINWNKSTPDEWDTPDINSNHDMNHNHNPNLNPNHNPNHNPNLETDEITDEKKIDKEHTDGNPNPNLKTHSNTNNSDPRAIILKLQALLDNSTVQDWFNTTPNL
jgi:hypothetical protein